MNGIRISLDEVERTAERISTCNQNMFDNLCSMKQMMNSLEGTWISDASSEIRERFNAFSNRFEQQRALIDSYVGFLKLTVSSYESLESTITSNASSIQS